MTGHADCTIRQLRPAKALTALAAALLLGACAQFQLDEGSGPGLASVGETGATPVAGKNEPPKSELQKATEYWGKEYGKNSRDLKTGLSYARNLKAMGRKQEAFEVLQQLSMFHGQNRELASEYGRLALDLGQVQVAQGVLAMAEDPANPDWRVVSARGTVLAKQGKYSEAIPFYERALQISPKQRSVMNNLALALTMSGDARRAEAILREADPQGADPKIRQNLALVMSLQGRHDEAKQIASASSGRVSEDVDTLRRIVKADPQPANVGGAPALRGAAAEKAVAGLGGWKTVVAEGR